jgi:uncharacterized cupredoxin-like copper-binding protein
MLVGAGCGSSGGHDHDAAAGGHDHEAMADGTVPGEPVDASESDRKVEIEATDDLRFDPSSIEVAAGEAITFVVRNVGKSEHEFVLGDEAYQEAHDAEMEGSHHMMDMDNSLTIPPGKTAELTWKFTTAGEVLYGCHEPGHYAGGMVGSIQVD